MPRAVVRALFVTLAATAAVPARADIQLIGTGAIPGTATDQSGLTNLLEDGVTPNNRVGLGSALAYTGFGEFYLATPDRGPADGTTTYTDRAYVVRIPIRPNSAAPGGYLVSPAVVATTGSAHRTIRHVIPRHVIPTGIACRPPARGSDATTVERYVSNDCSGAVAGLGSVRPCDRRRKSSRTHGGPRAVAAVEAGNVRGIRDNPNWRTTRTHKQPRFRCRVRNVVVFQA